MNFSTRTVNKLNCIESQSLELCCAPQVLVIDRPNGPADMLMDIVGKLSERELCVVSAATHLQVIQAIQHGQFDLVVFGLEESRPAMLDLIPVIQAQHDNIPVIVIGDRPARHGLESVHPYGAEDYFTLPARAAEMKSVVRRIIGGYLSCAS